MISYGQPRNTIASILIHLFSLCVTNRCTALRASARRPGPWLGVVMETTAAGTWKNCAIIPAVAAANPAEAELAVATSICLASAFSACGTTLILQWASSMTRAVVRPGFSRTEPRCPRRPFDATTGSLHSGRLAMVEIEHTAEPFAELNRPID
jgi:hypothetical protein